MIGHNDAIAWGFTNLGPDVTDLYLERMMGDTLLTRASRAPLTTRQETIKVAGGADGQITVRSTRHGPLISDVRDEVSRQARTPGRQARPSAYAVALPVDRLTPGRTADALFALDHGHELDRVPRCGMLFDVPAQNLVYADTDGPHRLPGAGTDPDPRDRPGRLAGAGLGPEVRLDRVRPVRRVTQR